MAGLDWPTIITTVLGSGVLISLLNIAIDWFRQGRKDEGARRYLSMQLAVAFENYAIDCMDAHSENENNKSSGGHMGRELTHLLELPELPSLDGYQLLSPTLLDRIYNLRQTRTMAGRSIINIADYGDESEVPIELSEQSLALAKECREIAIELRKEAKLPARRLAYKKYDVDEYMADEIADVAKRRTRYDQRHSDPRVQLTTTIEVMEKRQAKIADR